MTSEQWIAIITAIGSTVAMIIVLVFNQIAAQKTQVRIDLILESRVREGETSAVIAKMATKDSPFVVTAQTSLIFKNSGIVPELRKFYATKCIGLSDGHFMSAIEKEFGERMLKEIAKPSGMEHTACVRSAMCIAQSCDQPSFKL